MPLHRRPLAGHPRSAHDVVPSFWYFPGGHLSALGLVGAVVGAVLGTGDNVGAAVFEHETLAPVPSFPDAQNGSLAAHQLGHVLAFVLVHRLQIALFQLGHAVSLTKKMRRPWTS